MLVGRKKLLLSDTTASLLPVGLAQEATDHPPDVVCDEDIEEAFRVLEEHHDRIIADGDDDVQVLDFAVAGSLEGRWPSSDTRLSALTCLHRGSPL